MNDHTVIEIMNFIFAKVLNLDPQKSFLLNQLGHECLTVHVKDFATSYVLTPRESQLEVSISNEVKGHSLSANSGLLIAMALSENPQTYIQKGIVVFHGDMQILQRYSQFFKAIRPDLIFTLTQGRSPMMSLLLTRPLEIIKNWILINKEKFPIELREYLQYEQNLFPCKAETEDFFMDVQRLKQDLDRVNAKLNKYLKHQGANNE